MGQVIGKKLGLGFIGSVSRASDSVVMAYPAKGEDIHFGDPVVLNADGTVSKVGSASTADAVIGFAVRGVYQAKTDLAGGFFFREGDTVDVLVRGSMTVALKAGSPTLKGGVHVRTAAEGNLAVGDIVAAEAAGKTIALTDVVFASGEKDANGACEITILRRKI